MLRQKEYDLILMDIQMPEIDGYKATEIIRKEMKLKVPIIAITAHVFSGEREKCINFGMNDYLSKPIKEEEFFNLLREYLPEGFYEAENLKNKVAGLEVDFDRKYIFALTRGNKELLSELAKLTVEQSTLEMKEIEEAFQQKLYSNIAASAHSMRSTVLNMGFNKLMGQVLENLVREVSEEEPNHKTVNKLIIELKELREQAETFLTVEFLDD